MKTQDWIYLLQPQPMYELKKRGQATYAVETPTLATGFGDRPGVICAAQFDDAY